ncbi:MAG: 2-dehydro-3-deoxygalactonokinase, partial [Paracoccaceae bacterium]
VDDAVAQPASIAAELFRLRASSLIDAMAPQKARARLSGLLIGLELAAARPIWRDMKVTIVGRNDLAHLYQAGLQARGVSPEVAVCEDMALAGLIAAYETWTMSVP